MDLSKINDINKLYELYVQCNEALINAQTEIQGRTQDMQIIRARMAQLSSKNLEAEDKKISKG